MKKTIYKIKYKILYLLTYYEISKGKQRHFYYRYTKDQLKDVAHHLVNEYLNF
jgi:hypothetical protein